MSTPSASCRSRKTGYGHEQTSTEHIEMATNNVGFCPNCAAKCDKNAAKCVVCGASFEAGSSWRPTSAAPAIRRTRTPSPSTQMPANWERAKRIINRCWLVLTLLPLVMYLFRLLFSSIFPMSTGVGATSGLWALFVWVAAGTCLWIAYTVLLTGVEFLLSFSRSRW